MAAAIGLAAPVAGASADSCPNAAYRTGAGANLPDCRAYELVSGGFFEGMPTLSPDLGLPVSASDVIATNLGAGAGTDANNGVYGTDYQFARTGSGWAATPLDPPTASYQGSFVVDMSSDLSTALLMTTPPGAQGAASRYGGLDDELVLRNAAGEYVQVGPLAPTPAAAESSDPVYMGGSADLSHVVFSLEGGVWRPDPTVSSADSLYEYVGTGNTAPQLVGVDDSGAVISGCGTKLGSTGSTYNAISSSGSTIYFTAVGADDISCGESQPPVDQLYARVDGVQTLEISAPSPDGCTIAACTGAPAADAFFEGASSDGSKVFFTSTQQLLDTAAEDDTAGDSARTGCPLTTGASGCNLYEYDFDNPAESNLVDVSGGGSDPQVQGVARISEDGSHVYFVAKGVLATNQGAATDPNTGQPEVAQAGADNLYVFERDSANPDGKTTFIAQLSPSDSADWSSSDSRPAQSTPDGDFLVFPSVEDLTPDDDSTVAQIFEYDALTGTLVRVSHGQDGYNGDGNTTTQAATIPIQWFGANGSVQEAKQAGLAVASDGSVVVFSSNDALAPGALDDPKGNDRNAYEWEAPGAGSCAAGTPDGCVYLISDGKDDQCGAAGLGCGATLWGLDPSGQDIFFETSDALVAQDGNTQSDIYDARVDGGFPPPATSASCSGDACQGSPTAAPTLPVAMTVSFTGPGNVKLPDNRVVVAGKAVERDAFMLRVKVPGPGRIAVSGTELRSVSTRVTRAHTYRLRVALTAKCRRLLARRRRLRVTVQITYTPTGGVPATVRAAVIFRAKGARR